jgi:hypothetical protein
VIGALREALSPLSLDEKKTLRGLLGKLCPAMGIEPERARKKKGA